MIIFIVNLTIIFTVIIIIIGKRRIRGWLSQPSLLYQWLGIERLNDNHVHGITHSSILSCGSKRMPIP